MFSEVAENWLADIEVTKTVPLYPNFALISAVHIRPLKRKMYVKALWDVTSYLYEISTKPP